MGWDRAGGFARIASVLNSEQIELRTYSHGEWSLHAEVFGCYDHPFKGNGCQLDVALIG